MTNVDSIVLSRVTILVRNAKTSKYFWSDIIMHDKDWGNTNVTQHTIWSGTHSRSSCLLEDRLTTHPVLWEPTRMQAKSSAASSYSPIWLSTPVKNHKAERKSKCKVEWALLSSYHTASRPVSIRVSSGTSHSEIILRACVLLRMLCSFLDNWRSIIGEFRDEQTWLWNKYNKPVFTVRNTDYNHNFKSYPVKKNTLG